MNVILPIDEAGFEVEMAAQRQRARDAGKFPVDYNNIVKVEGETQFDGYDATQGQGQIVAIYKDGVQVDEINEGDETLIVLNKPRSMQKVVVRLVTLVFFKTIRYLWVQDTKIWWCFCTPRYRDNG